MNQRRKIYQYNQYSTGETKPFQKGFAIILVLILILLIPLLSGCMKIENTLDMSELESINNHFRLK